MLHNQVHFLWFLLSLFHKSTPTQLMVTSGPILSAVSTSALRVLLLHQVQKVNLSSYFDFHAFIHYISATFRVRFFRKSKIGFLNPKESKNGSVLRFFSKQINPRFFGSYCVTGTEESTSRVDSSIPLTHHDPRDLGLICLVKKRKIRFRIVSLTLLQKRTRCHSSKVVHFKTRFLFDQLCKKNRIFNVLL